MEGGVGTTCVTRAAAGIPRARTPGTGRGGRKGWWKGVRQAGGPATCNREAGGKAAQGNGVVSSARARPGEATRGRGTEAGASGRASAATSWATWGAVGSQGRHTGVGREAADRWKDTLGLQKAETSQQHRGGGEEEASLRSHHASPASRRTPRATHRPTHRTRIEIGGGARGGPGTLRRLIVHTREGLQERGLRLDGAGNKNTASRPHGGASQSSGQPLIGEGGTVSLRWRRAQH